MHDKAQDGDVVTSYIRLTQHHHCLQGTRCTWERGPIWMILCTQLYDSHNHSTCDARQSVDFGLSNVPLLTCPKNGGPVRCGMRYVHTPLF